MTANHPHRRSADDGHEPAGLERAAELERVAELESAAATDAAGGGGGVGRDEAGARAGGWSFDAVDRLVAVAAEAAQGDPHRPASVGEVPALEGLLDLVGLSDRIIAMVIEQLIELKASGEVEAATGVPVSLWLAQVARRTSSDVRMLETAADLLPLLPGIRAAFGDGRLSWSQLRAVVLTARPFRRSVLDAVDAQVCSLLERVPDTDPDQVTLGLNALAWQLDEQREAERAERAEAEAERSEFFAMQPRLDGTGGRVWGEFGSVGFATLDAALNSGLDLPATGDGNFAGREGRSQVRESAGKQRARRLLGWAKQALDPGLAPDGDSAGAGGGLLLRTSLDSLLGLSREPGDLLTHLTGGRMHVTSATARRIVDEGGAQLGMVVLDDTGSVVGVGTRTRVPPDWLRDAALALNATCQGPGCTAPARTCELDHARPWKPARGEQRGPTDVTNLGPLCGTQNHRKERGGWRATGSPDGQRHWYHPRTGLHIHHLPDHYHHPPPESDPSPWSGDRPPGTDPPSAGDRPSGTGPPSDVGRRSPTSSDPPDDPTVAELIDPLDPDIPF